MSKEIAKKLIAELQENEELKAKIAGITDKDELVKMAKEAEYDVTAGEMIEAEHEYRAELAAKTDELSADELESAAGGIFWLGDERPDGTEFGCFSCNLGYDDQRDRDEWCSSSFYCKSGTRNPEKTEKRKKHPSPRH